MDFGPLGCACAVFEIKGSEALRMSFVVVGERLYIRQKSQPVVVDQRSPRSLFCMHVVAFTDLDDVGTSGLGSLDESL